MFETFLRNFTADPDRASDTGIAPNFGIAEVDELIARFGGASFNRGIYRIMRVSDVKPWQARISLGFPEIGPRVTCFGYDWLGRVFAADGQRRERGRAAVMMFEPGTGLALEIPETVEGLHDKELVSYGEEVLAVSLHERWLANGGPEPAFGECIGFKVPMFLGGSDDLGNLELSDIEVYWHLTGQLIVKTRDLPPDRPHVYRLNRAAVLTETTTVTLWCNCSGRSR